MDIRQEIENLMPGAWSKVLFLGSLALCIGLYKFFPDLPKSWLPQTEAETFLIRILLSGSALLLGSVSLVFLLVLHHRKNTAELSNLTKQNTSYFHQVSSLNTDKKTLQDLLNETKQNFDDLTAKQISLRESNSKLDELNKIHLAEISRLSGATNEFREEFVSMRNQATESQKKYMKLKEDYDVLQQRYSETERLANERKFLLEVAGKKIAELSKSDPLQRSFPGPKIPIEPASASSEPGPDDYHAKRRSFFHSEDDRPKRR